MHSAHDLLSRWPALDVRTKRARLQDTFQLSAGGHDPATIEDLNLAA